MKLKMTLFSLFLLTSVQIFSQKTDPKAIAIIEKSIAAKGGKEALMNVKTLYTKMATTMDGRDVFWITKEMAPNKGSFEIEYQGRTVYKSFYDGKKGYKMVRGEKKLADQDEYKDKKYRKYIMNELEYIDPELYKLEYIETSADDKNNKIKATYVNGKISYLYYDKTTNLLTKKETVANANKNTFETVVNEDYKKFGNLLNETKQTYISGDSKQVAILKELIVNQFISDKDFE